jgi:prephenate dehydratase
MPMRYGRSVVFQGELGAFSQSAAQKLLGDNLRFLPCPTFADVFDVLKQKKADHAVIPIENTLHGSVHDNYDLLVECDYFVTGETKLRISHQLITMPEVTWRSVKQVFSHPVALNQCRRFFQKYPQIKPIPFYDTAGSVKMLQETRTPASGAIASVTAASIYGGRIQKRDIEDNPENYTRFFLLSKQRKAPKTTAGPGWKTSLVFSTPNQPGALFKALACFALRNISLTKIESRPIQGKPWEYRFYLDLEGPDNSDVVKRALSNLSELTDWMKILGSYQSTL